MYFASRDEKSRSRTFASDVVWTPDGPKLSGAIDLVLDIGPVGAFDDAGAMPSWVVADGNGKLLLYYTGWNLGKTVPFYFYIGLAVSDDGGRTFRRHSPAPILDRSPVDPYLTASPCVIREGKLWRMWYVSGDRWIRTAHGVKHYYNIRYAESSNGYDWRPTGRVCIDFAHRSEYAFGRPSVAKVSDGYVMWYAFRGSSYRVGMAWSRDGLHWTRNDAAAGFPPSNQGWDSEMVEYLQVVRRRDKWFGLYNGNGYGRSGIGLAEGMLRGV